MPPCVYFDHKRFSHSLRVAGYVAVFPTEKSYFEFVDYCADLGEEDVVQEEVDVIDGDRGGEEGLVASEVNPRFFSTSTVILTID